MAIAVVWRFLLEPRRRPDQHAARRHRDQRPGLAGEPVAGDALDHRDGRLAQPRVRHGRVHRRAAGDPGDALRGGLHRRRRALAGLPLRDPADAPADDPLHARHHDDRLPPAVRGAVRDDRRRAARRDPVRDDVHVPAGLHVLPPGLRVGDRLRPVRDRRDRRLPPVQVPPVGDA